MDKFENKTVVITGASQGIGEAAARMFAELGANVISVSYTHLTLPTKA